MSKPIVFVIGATGSVGSATVKALSVKYSSRVDIRAGVRNPDKAGHLNSLAGVTVVKAEMGTAELENTLRGVYSLLIIPPPAQNRAELATTTAASAKKAGVAHQVIISGGGVELNTDFTKQWSEMEAGVKALGVAYTFLRLPFFIDNFWSFKDSIKSARVINNPTDPTKAFTTVVVADIGNAAATVLVEPASHANKAYTIASDYHSYGDLAAAFGEALGKPVTYNRVSYEDTRKQFLAAGIPEAATDTLLGFFRFVDAQDPIACVADTGDYQKITGKQPTSLKAWVAQVKAAFE